MGPALVQGPVAAWPAQAVRDTLTSLAQDPAYDRSVRQSLWQAILERVGRLFQWLLDLLPPIPGSRWLVVALGVAVAALVVARIVLHARAPSEFWAGERGDARTGGRAAPWREAERLAALGEHLEAAHQLCAAVLVQLMRRGEVTLHPSKTTGDYARELRRRGARGAGDFQRFRARYDRVVYDRQACSADEFAALLQDARPLLRDERQPLGRAA